MKKLNEMFFQLIPIAKGINIYPKKDRACRGWGKKLQGHFLISSIGNVKHKILLKFQNRDREVRLTLYDRAYLCEKLLFNKLFPKMPHLTGRGSHF